MPGPGADGLCQPDTLEETLEVLPRSPCCLQQTTHSFGQQRIPSFGVARPTRLDEAVGWLRGALPDGWTTSVTRRDAAGGRIRSPLRRAPLPSSRYGRSRTQRPARCPRSPPDGRTDARRRRLAERPSPADPASPRSELPRLDRQRRDPAERARPVHPHRRRQTQPLAPSRRRPRASVGRKRGPSCAPWPRFRLPSAVRELAEAVDVDAGYVSRVLRVLEDELLVTRRPRGPITGVEWDGSSAGPRRPTRCSTRTCQRPGSRPPAPSGCSTTSPASAPGGGPSPVPLPPLASRRSLLPSRPSSSPTTPSACPGRAVAASDPGSQRRPPRALRPDRVRADGDRRRDPQRVGRPGRARLPHRQRPYARRGRSAAAWMRKNEARWRVGILTARKTSGRRDGRRRAPHRVRRSPPCAPRRA